MSVFHKRHALYRVKLFFFGIALRVIGYMMYVVSGCVAIGVISISDNKLISEIVRNGVRIEVLNLLLLFLVTIFIAGQLIKLGHYLFMRGKRFTAKYKTLRSDRSGVKPVVLYLRSFSDDLETSTTRTSYLIRSVKLPQLTTEEEVLMKEFNQFGTFVTAAKPGKLLPNPGALRMRFKEDSWKEEIKHLMRSARFVLIRIGKGKHLQWEIQQALKLVPPQKLLFLLPSNQSAYSGFQNTLREATSKYIPDIDSSEFIEKITLRAIVYFDQDFEPKISLCRHAGHKTSSSKPLKPILRYTLKPIYTKLGIEWRPPPLPKEVYIPVIFYTYSTLLCLGWCLFNLTVYFEDPISLSSKWEFLILLIDLIVLFGLIKGIRRLNKSVSVLIKAIKQKV